MTFHSAMYLPSLDLVSKKQLSTNQNLSNACVNSRKMTVGYVSFHWTYIVYGIVRNWAYTPNVGLKISIFFMEIIAISKTRKVHTSSFYIRLHYTLTDNNLQTSTWLRWWDWPSRDTTNMSMPQSSPFIKRKIKQLKEFLKNLHSGT